MRFVVVLALVLAVVVPAGGTTSKERDESGIIVAREIKVKPNGNAMFESDVVEATDEIARVWVEEGRMFEPGEDGSEEAIGRIIESGPQIDRVRAIEPDDSPLLQVEPREDGVWEIRVEMVSCSAATCVFGVQAYAR